MINSPLGCFHHAVGVADPSIIPDSQMTASTYFTNEHAPHFGRINDTRGDGWGALYAKDPSDWLQVDFGRTAQVCAVETQGDTEGDEWVIDFSLSFSSDGVSWTHSEYANDTQVVSYVSSRLFLDLREVMMQLSPTLRNNYTRLD